MGKDKNGAYIAPKGKPSGSENQTHHLKDAFAAIDPETEKAIAEKYTEDGADEISANVHVRHPNRNVNKNQEEEDDQ